jgi:hypothetical protein
MRTSTCRVNVQTVVPTFFAHTVIQGNIKFENMAAEDRRYNISEVQKCSEDACLLKSEHTESDDHNENDGITTLQYVTRNNSTNDKIRK